MGKIYHVLKEIIIKPISSVMVNVFILCLITNIMWLTQIFNGINLLGIIGMTGLEAYALGCIYYLLNKVKCGKIFAILIIAITNICIIIDYFCYMKFSKVIGQDVMDIIAETNPEETIEFLETYLNIWIILAIVCLCTILNIASLKLSKYLAKLRWVKSSMVIAAILGIVCFGYSSACYILYRNGNSMPQYTSITRAAYSTYILKQRINEIEASATLYDTLDAVKDKDNTAIVFVIGESFNKYHSSAYGYTKDTNPYIGQRIANGEMLKFNDAITVTDHTSGAMTAIFRMSDDVKSPLFPMLFKKAGYSTQMIDNQYFIGGGCLITLLC